MRHQKKTVKLGRTAAHRKSMLANQVCSLIEHKRIKTTLAKAKAVRPLAEKMVTLGKRGDLHARRIAAGYLGQKDAEKNSSPKSRLVLRIAKVATPGSSSSASASAIPLRWPTSSGLIPKGPLLRLHPSLKNRLPKKPNSR